MSRVAKLLEAANAGDRDASAQMFEVVYADLKRIARNILRGTGGAAELNTTALVHESFLKMIRRRQLSSVDRAAFFTYIGKVMRSVLVDAIRERQAAKRGGGHAIGRSRPASPPPTRSTRAAARPERRNGHPVTNGCERQRRHRVGRRRAVRHRLRRQRVGRGERRVQQRWQDQHRVSVMADGFAPEWRARSTDSTSTPSQAAAD